jgi:hypothetical protein
VRLVVQVQAVVHEFVEIDFGRSFKASAVAAIPTVEAGASAAVAAISSVAATISAAARAAVAAALRASTALGSILLWPVLACWSSLLFWHVN